MAPSHSQTSKAFSILYFCTITALSIAVVLVLGIIFYTLLSIPITFIRSQ